MQAKHLKTFVTYIKYTPFIISLLLFISVIISYFWEFAIILAMCITPSLFWPIEMYLNNKWINFCIKNKLCFILNTIQIPIFCFANICIYTKGNLVWLLFELSVFSIFIIIYLIIFYTLILKNNKMFGYNIKHIAKGFYNDLFNKEQELYEKRIAICRQCPLYSVDNYFGAICDNKKYFNIETNEITPYPTNNSVSGCGCILSKKLRVKETQCNLNKW